ncbi:PAS domain S-box protein [Ectothiorhodospiraceae bacterium 2226]|nr:PAS domain S-box protein [Ectothiorhodospiraceae bacterium 2226]
MNMQGNEASPEDVLRAALDLMPLPVALLDADGGVRYTNPAWHARAAAGDPIAAATGRNMLAVLDAAGAAWAPEGGEALRSALASGIATSVAACGAPDGAGLAPKLLRFSRLETPTAASVLAMLEGLPEADDPDCDTRCQLLDALRDTGEKYRTLLRRASDPILTAAEDGRLIDASDRAESLLGYTREELAELTYRDIHPSGELARIERAFEHLLAHGHVIVMDTAVRRKDGEVVPVDLSARTITYGGRRVAQGIFRDVTERHHAERERLTQWAAQRDALVREVHHRIKNNLQGVVGLLRQQAAEQPEVARLLVSGLAQLQSVAVVHGLQARGQHDEVRLCEMVEAISHTAAELTAAHVHLPVEVDILRRIQIAPGECVPMALILNELVINAIKHGGATGDGVRVSLHRDGSSAEVQVHNPQGTLPPGFDFDGGERLGTGLSLIKSLLPPEGAWLDVRADQGGVTARLRLAHPVLVQAPAS